MTLAGRAVTVVGAGIAGLAAARALALRGAQVTVLEQAGALAEVGAGLQVSPNGAAVLRALGLGEALAAAGLRAAAVSLRDGRDDRVVATLDLARQRPGQEYRFVHRADLVDLLAQGARDAGVQFRMMQRIVAAETGPGGVRLVTAQGAGMREGLVIGADGLHSVLRGALNGPAAPAFTGQVAWRATIPETPAAGAVAEVHMGPGRHLVSYPLRGGTLRNIVAVEARARWVEESWSLKDDPIALRLAFAGFSPRVRGWLDRVGDAWLWGLFRHPVAARWWWAEGDAGAAILGDAAHPTLPFLAQGANMALEDAWVLAARLAGTGPLARRLAAYQQARAARAARIVAAASRNAWAYHLRGPVRDVAHLGLRAIGALAPGALVGRFDWLYGHDVTAA
ncbi:MAG: FAD-dependent monooxygenase [Gemmobacter sp.]